MKKSYKFNATGKSINEVYTITFPDNLIKFITYDFSAFTEKSAELCKLSMKSGYINREEIVQLRSSITPCHRYFERNIHGVFEKIVFDNWIEHICKLNEVNTSTLWNSFANCRTEFEEVLFARLCEFRYNTAINQWVNLLRVQEYALKKADFIFGKKLESHAGAVAKAGYFDLMFNIAANELGCGELSTTKVYANLRTPNSPFVMSGASREIMRNVLGRINHEGFSSRTLGANASPHTADKAAMEAFSVMKHAIPDEADAVIMKSIPRIAERVYIPESFKAVIDLEIDLLLENGAVMQKCGRCLNYFLRDDEYDHDYCSRKSSAGSARTCLDIMGEKMAAISKNALSTVDLNLLYSRCDQLYKEMAERVNLDMTQRDFSEWYKGLSLIRENIVAGRARMDDFENFAEYSRAIDFMPAKKRPKVESSTETVDGTRAYKFERVDSSKTRKPEKVDTADSGDVRTLAELYGIELESEEPELEPAPFYPTSMFGAFASHFPTAFSPTSQTFPQTFPPLPPTAQDADYAANITPPQTARVIRGVVPVGVKELPQPVLTTPSASRPPLQGGELPPPVEFAPPPEPPEFVFPDPAAFEPQTIEPAEELLLKTLELPRVPKNPEPPRLLKPPPAPKTAVNSIELLPPKPVKRLELTPPKPKPAKSANKAKSLLELPKPSAKSGGSEEQPQIKIIEPSHGSDTLDFGSILSGIQRNDSFEMPANAAKSSKIADSADTVNTHKTRRVMDAIFGKNKVSNPLVKANFGASGEAEAE